MPDSNVVMRWAGITRRQLDHWVDKEFIKPVRHSGRGLNGVQYDWSMEEARVVERMGKLVAAGIPPAMAHKFARGDQAAIERLLYAVAPCVTELRWRLLPGDEVRGRSTAASEPEPCG